MASSVPAAKAALLAQLQTAATSDPDLAGVDIYEAGDDTGLTGDERIVVLTSRDIRREWGPIRGPQVPRLEETYVLRVDVEVIQPGSDRLAAETRLWEIVTAVEKAVLTDIRLGGTVRSCMPAGAPGGEITGPATDGHVGAAVELRFFCEARVDLT